MNRTAAIIFWSIMSSILWLIFGIRSGNFIYSFYFLAFFLPVVITTAWIFSGILVPGFLLKQKYRRFALYSFYTVVLSLDLELVLIFVAFMLISIYDYENMGIIIDSYKWMPVIMYFIVIFYAFLEISIRLIARQRLESQGDDRGTITVRADRRNRLIRLSEVTYIESMADYIRIFLSNGEKVITREKISRLHERLPGEFIRIHRSYVINRQHMDSYNRERAIIAGKELPLSRTYKNEFFEKLSERN